MTMTADMPRRSADRVPFAARLIVVRGDRAWFVDLLDLASGGCGIFRPRDCALEEDQLVHLFFHERDNSPAICVPARVARVGTTRIGFEYHEPQAIPPRPAQ